MKKKLMILVPLLVVLGLGGFWKMNSAAGTAKADVKVKGSVYVLGKQFLINLADDKFAQVTVGLVLAPGESAAPEKPDEEAPKPPDGFGPMAQEAVVRDVITDELTGLTSRQLIRPKSRARVKRVIAKALERHTDVHVEDVLFTDVTVQ